MNAPEVRATVVIPARNEEAWIRTCLDHVLKQDFPHDQLEVIVVDGASTDATAATARRVLQDSDLARWEVVANDAATTPTSLNLGLARATGDVVCRVDARSLIAEDYVSRCIEVLGSLEEVQVVGGVQHAVAGGESVVARGIARALNNRVGTGFARYRRRISSGPADTVYLGAFRRVDLVAVGGWNEAFATNQDYELNRRMAERGAVWFDAELSVDYVSRPDLPALWKQYHRFGRWKAQYWKATGDRPRPRQIALLVGVPAAAVGGVVLFARAKRARVALATAAALGLLAYDRASERDGAPVPVRAAAVVANGVIGAAWLSGAWSGVLAAPPANDASR